MTAEDLLRLLHFNRPGIQEPRAVLAIGDEYDWERRPARPSVPDPGAVDYDAYDAAWFARRRHDQHWPDLPRKIVRRMIRRGWMEETSPGRLTVTPAAHRLWYRWRYGVDPGRPIVYRKGTAHKRRPKGHRCRYSRYRWRTDGRGRRSGGTPHVAPHVLEALSVAEGLSRGDESEPPTRKEWRRYGWAGRRRADRQQETTR